MGSIIRVGKDFYDSFQWRECRMQYIEAHDLCEQCGAPAEVVHHIEHLTKANINNPQITLNSENLQALCHLCHNRVHFRKQDDDCRYEIAKDGSIIEVHRDE
jgi:hypothetical protein